MLQAGYGQQAGGYGSATATQVSLAVQDSTQSYLEFATTAGLYCWLLIIISLLVFGLAFDLFLVATSCKLALLYISFLVCSHSTGSSCIEGLS